MRLSAHRLVRAAVALTPPRLRPVPPPRGLVLKLSAEGEIEFGLEDPDGSGARGVTSAVEAPDGRLWLGSLHDAGAQAVELGPALRALRAAGGRGAEAAGNMAGRLRARRAKEAAAAAEEEEAAAGEAAEAAAAAEAAQHAGAQEGAGEEAAHTEL
jgi:hypothetical protein